MKNINNLNELSHFEIRYKSWHTWLSYIKSGIRIGTSLGTILVASFGSMFDPMMLLISFAIGYGLAEIIGVIEEL